MLNSASNEIVQSTMVLRTTMTSPFGRKVRMAAKVLGLEPFITIAPADTLDEGDTLRQQNPLGKMPTLLLADGSVIFDSRVIVEYLDGLSGRPRLLPQSGIERYRVLTRATIADGIMDAGLLMVYEGRFRQPEQTSERWLSHQRGKILRAMTSMQQDLPDPHTTDIVSIGLACALSYLDWREPVRWRGDFPILEDWLNRFATSEPAYNATGRPEQG